MGKQQQDTEPILVKDPQTEQFIDIRPVFDFISWYQEDDTERNLKHVKESLDDLFMMAAKGSHNDILQEESDRFRNNMHFLERMHMTFHSITVFKKQL